MLLFLLIQEATLIWAFRTDDDKTSAHTMRGAQVGVKILPPPPSVCEYINIHAQSIVMLSKYLAT